MATSTQPTFYSFRDHAFGRAFSYRAGTVIGYRDGGPAGEAYAALVEPVPAGYVPLRDVVWIDREQDKARHQTRVEPPAPTLYTDDEVVTVLGLVDVAQLEAIRRAGYLRPTHLRGEATLTPETAFLPYREWQASITGQPMAVPKKGWLK